MRATPMPYHRHAGIFTTLLIAGCASASPLTPIVKRPPAAATAAVSAPEVVVAPTPLRRLSNEEYNNSVRDLLGDNSRPADAFPPDEIAFGFENNSGSPVTQIIVERYMDAAEAIARRAVERIGTLAPCAEGSAPDACARAFIETFGRLAYRRPLDDDERASLFAIYADKEKRAGYAPAVELVISAILQSPKFLYRLELADGATQTRPLSGYEMAARLSYFLWVSTPDQVLLDAAASGQLITPAAVEQHARRMLADQRAQDGIRSFHRQWLDLRALHTMSKVPAVYAAFSPDLKAAMLEETLRFSANAVLSGGDTVATLLTSRKSFVNGALAKLYGVPAPEGNGFAPADLPVEQRSGLLTQASVMSVLASAEDTSPILRGKFVREKILCDRIEPPPPNAIVALPPYDPKKTKRQRFARHRADPACSTCHATLDPVGFGFENYDAVGAWRTAEHDVPIDASGTLYRTEDADGPFEGAIELSARLAKSPQVRRCYMKQWFRAALGRVEEPGDAAALEEMYKTFARAGFDARELIVAIVKSDVFRHAGFSQAQQAQGDAP